MTHSPTRITVGELAVRFDVQKMLGGPEQTRGVLAQAFAAGGPVVVEVDMPSWGPFAARFAGPILKKQ